MSYNLAVLSGVVGCCRMVVDPNLVVSSVCVDSKLVTGSKFTSFRDFRCEGDCAM